MLNKIMVIVSMESFFQSTDGIIYIMHIFMTYAILGFVIFYHNMPHLCQYIEKNCIWLASFHQYANVDFQVIMDYYRNLS